MVKQLEIEMAARCRKTDPGTSFEAAQKVEASGKTARDRKACLEIVRARPGRTAAEIARMAGLERHVPSRRLPELREAGLVRKGYPRKCRLLGTRCITWEST